MTPLPANSSEKKRYGPFLLNLAMMMEWWDFWQAKSKYVGDDLGGEFMVEWVLNLVHVAFLKNSLGRKSTIESPVHYLY